MKIANVGALVFIALMFSVSLSEGVQASDLPPSASIWTAALGVDGWNREAVAPSMIRISGRVFTSEGYPIRNAYLTLYVGNPPFAGLATFTGSMGTYVFDGLPADLSYNMIVSAKRYRFPQWQQQVPPGGSDTVDFVAFPVGEF